MASTAQIIDQAIRRLSELSTSAPVHWTRAELLDYLTEAVNELNLIAAEIQTTETVSTVNNVNAYSLGATAIAPMAVRVNGYYLQREPVNELDNKVDWEEDNQKRLNIRVWSPMGLQSFIIWPRPLIQPTSMQVEEMAMHPTIIDDPTFFLSIRPEYETAIEDYMVHRAMFREGGPELDQMEPFYARFLDAVQQLSGRNVIRRYPAWDIEPETKTSETTYPAGLEPGGKQ
jgi:hypothetical protein